jgi:hypothetical protein
MPSRACSPNSPASGLKHGVFTSIVDLQAAIDRFIARIGRAPTAFCACELRSPARFTDAGFVAFNRHHVERLAAWGIFHDDINPVAHSNVFSEIDPATTPSFYAFSYAVPDENRAVRSFVAAGSG